MFSPRRSHALLLAAALLLAHASAASPTDPVLVVNAVRTATGAGAAWVRIEGVFPGEDLVQLPYPLQLVVHQQGLNPQYVRYDLSGTVVSGQSSLLSGGLLPAEAEALLAAGGTPSGGAVVQLGADRIEVMLPTGFPAGPAQAQLFVIHDGEAIVSNTVPFTIAGSTP